MLWGSFISSLGRRTESRVHRTAGGLILFLCAATLRLQAVTITLDAEVLKNADGSAMPTSGLVILVASTNGVTFGGPTTNSLISGADLELFRWDLSAFASNGVLSGITADLPLTGTWQSGDPLQLYWFPTLTISSTNHGGLTPYGQYRSAVGSDGSDPWVTPALNSATISLKFYSADAVFLNAGGSNPADAGRANLKTPPVTIAHFTATPTNGVVPVSVTFADTSEGPITNRFWDFGDGSTTNTTSTNLVHQYATAGTNTVTLIISGTDGVDTNTQSNLILAINPPTVTASNNGPVCTGSPLNLTASTVAAATYSWTGPNGFTSTQQNPVISNPTLAAAGPYSVTVTVYGYTSAAGTTSVTMNPGSVGGTATPATNSVCNGTGTTISLTGQTGTIVKWQSSPDNSTWGDIASTDNPYGTGNLSAMTYYRAVVQNGSCSAANSTAAQVTVNPIVTPSVSIGANPGTTNCAGTAVIFTATPVYGGSAPTYVWKKNSIVVGGSGNSYTNNSPANGDTIDCQLTANAGCLSQPTATAPQLTLVVTTPPSVSNAPTNWTACAGSAAAFHASASGSPAPTMQWQVSTNSGTSWSNLANATNANYSFSSGITDGGNEYRAVFSNVCNSVNSAVATLTVTPGQLAIHPTTWNFGPVATGVTVQASLIVSNAGCGLLSGTATSALPFAVVSGSPFTVAGLGTTNVVVSFQTATEGWFTNNVVFTTDGGVSTNQLVGQGWIAPVAQFTATPTNGVVPVTVTFTDTSTGAITNRFWDFGDGGVTNTTGTNVVYQYTLVGTYPVQLIVSGPVGSSTNLQSGLITALPVPTATIGVFAGPVNGGTVSGGGTYPVGTNVQISATASNGWNFINWSDGSTTNPYTIPVPATNITYTANFAQPKTINVPAGYGTIQAAINAANPGDTIAIAAGRYNEDLTIPKTLTLLGSGTNTCVLYATNTTPVVSITGPGTVQLANFEINGGQYVFLGGSSYYYSGSTEKGIVATNVTLVLNNMVLNQIRNYFVTLNTGYLYATNVSLFTRDIVQQCDVGFELSGCTGSIFNLRQDAGQIDHTIDISDTPPRFSSLRIDQTRIHASELTWGNCIRTYVGSQLTITNCFFYRNYETPATNYPGLNHNGIGVNGYSNLIMIVGNTFSNLPWAIGYYGSPGAGYGGNQVSVERNLIMNSSSGGIFIGGNQYEGIDLGGGRWGSHGQNYFSQARTDVTGYADVFMATNAGAYFSSTNVSAISNCWSTANPDNSIWDQLDVGTLGRVFSAPTFCQITGFTASPTSGTVPLTVTFTDTSTGLITNWDWAFGDGGSTNLTVSTNVVYQYLTAGTNYATLTVSGMGGATSSTQTIVVLNPPPIITQSPQSATNCVGNTAEFTVGVSGAGTLVYQWQQNGSTLGESGHFSGTGTTNLTITPVASGDAANYRCVVSNDGGSITSAVASLTVNTNVTPLVSVAASPALTNCAGATVIFTATPVNGGNRPSYVWNKSGSTVVGITGNIYTNASPADGDTIDCQLTPSVACALPATATAAQLTVGVVGTPAAAGTINGANTVCSNATGVAYAIAAVSGATGYNWSVPAGASITLGQGTTNITVNWGTASTGPVTVTPTNSCVSGGANNLTVTVTSAPAGAGTITGASTVCSNALGVGYAIAAVSGATGYNWSVPAGASIATGQGTTNITVNWLTAGTGPVTVTPTNSCFNGPVSSLTVTVTDAPVAAGAISGASTVCSNDMSEAYTIAPVSGATGYGWSVPAGATVASGQGTPSITVNWGTASSGNVTVTPTNSCFNGATNSLAVTVSLTVAPTVTVGANPGTNICAGTSVTFTAVPGNGGNAPSYVWKKNNGVVGGNTNSYTDASLVTGDTIDCQLTSNSGCVSPTTANAAQLTMTVNTAPSVSSSPTNLTVCAGTPVSFSAAASGIPTPTVQWQRSADGGSNWTDLADASNSTYSATAGANNNADQYRAVFSNVCTTTNSSAATLTVVAGQLAISPAAGWDFGAVATGVTVQTTFVLTNTGCGQLTGTATSAAPYAVDSGSSFMLPGYGTTNVLVSFTPVAVGWFTNHVVFTSDGGVVTNQVTGQGGLVAPVASFTGTPTNGQATLLVTFTDTSTGTITNRLWSFGDGGTTNTVSTNVVYAYTGPGSNTVQLTVSGPGGVSTSTQSNLIVVIAYPPGDVNGDLHVTSVDSLAINQVLVGLRASNSVVFAKTGYLNGDVNNNGTVSSVDSLAINQVLVGLRTYLVTKIVPGIRTNSIPTAVSIYGMGFPTNTVTGVTIGPPVNLTLSNIVVISKERINAWVPAGGGIGTGTVNVTASPSNSVTSFGKFINQ